MIDQKKEIDLINVIKNLFDKVKRNVILFISIIIVFVFIGFIYNTINKEYFTYSSIARTSLDKEVLSKFIDDLNLINSKENKILPKLVKIDINLNYEEYDNDFFNIELLLNDTTDIEQTIINIKEVLNENEYINRFIKNYKSSISQQINNYESEIKRINDIQNLVFNSNENKTTIISTNGMSKEKIEFQQEIIKLNEELNRIDVLYYVKNNLYIFKSSKNVIQTIVMSLFLGLFFGLFVIIIKK